MDQQEHSDILMQAVGPEIYRRNAFRVLGLATDAKAGDISRRLEEIKMLEKFGGGYRSNGGLAVDVSADPDLLQEAGARLSDPERRLVDEFFWFWPRELGQAGADPAIQALAEGDLRGACKVWLEQEANTGNGHIAGHNLAVMAHVLALDLEHDGSNGGGNGHPPVALDAYWRHAWSRWRAVLEQEAFWSRVAERIRELDDPRLTTGTARRMRSALPAALLTINARLAVRHAEQGDLGEVQKQMRLIQQSGFAQEVITAILAKAVAPFVERVQLFTESARQEAEADPAHADQPAWRLLEQVGEPLRIIDLLLPADHPTRHAAHDQPALCALQCQINYGTKQPPAESRWVCIRC